MPIIFRKCAYCGASFGKKKHRVTPFNNAFCSVEHSILRQKEIAFRFECLVCQKTVFTQPAQIKARNRKTCSRECLSKLSRSRAIERRAGGYTKHQLDRLARYSPEASTWRKSVFERDDYTCQICLKKGSYLEADHIKPWAFFPELRYELSNGRTLCRPCHDKTKIAYTKMREMYGVKA